MERSKTYTNLWLPLPYTLDLAARVTRDGNAVRDILVNNAYADVLGVAEIYLNIARFSALDAQGYEHSIMEFPGESAVRVQGLGSGQFLRSASVLSLEPGTYSAFRFDLNPSNNRFIYKDGSEEEVNTLSFLDFEMKHPLTITAGAPAEVRLWFDFAPYHLSRHFNCLNKGFAFWKSPKWKWAGSGQ